MSFTWAIIKGILIILIMAALLGLPVMWLWNWLMPGIFGLPTVGYFQGLGLVLLTGFFFRSNTASDSRRA